MSSTLAPTAGTATAEAPLIPVPKPEAANKLVIFAWSGELDRIWPTLILATTGAAMGKDVTIFFTFWGLFPLVKEPSHVTGDEWMQKMLAVLNRGGAHHLKLSKMNFVGMGPAMMRHIATEKHIASPEDLIDVCKDLGVKMIPCQMTMDMMGLHRDDLIDGLEEPAGAATALHEADGATTLFI